MKFARLLVLVGLLAGLCGSSRADGDDLPDTWPVDSSGWINYNNWEFDLGGGASLPLGSKGTYPALNAIYFVLDGNTMNLLGATEIISSPVKKTLKTSASGDLAVLYHLTHAFSFGVQFGYAFGHEMGIGEQDILDHALVAAGNHFTVDYSMKVADLAALFKVAPWMSEGRLRPFVLFGPAIFNVHQDSSLTLAGYTFRFHDVTDNYLGATAGGGLAYQFERNWWLSLQAQYEKVFKPGDTLQFLVPSMQLTFHF